jgi:hypothetical protein
MLNNILGLHELTTVLILIQNFPTFFFLPSILMFELQPSSKLMIMVTHCLMCKVLQVDVEVFNWFMCSYFL